MSQVDAALTDVALVVTQQTGQLAPRIDAWCKRSAEADDIAELVPAELISDAHETDAVDVCKLAADLRKEIDTARKVIVQPFNGVVRVVNGTLGSIINEMRSLEATMKGRVLVLRRKRENKRLADEEQARKDSAAQVNGTSEAVQLPASKPAASTARGSGVNPGAMTARKIVRFRVIDFSKLPDDYKIVDEPLLRIAGKKSPLPTIPGIEWYEDETLSIR